MAARFDSGGHQEAETTLRTQARFWYCCALSVVVGTMSGCVVSPPPRDAVNLIVSRVPSGTTCIVLLAESEEGLTQLPPYIEPAYDSSRSWTLYPILGYPFREQVPSELHRFSQWSSARRYALLTRDTRRRWREWWIDAAAVRIEGGLWPFSSGEVTLEMDSSGASTADATLVRVGVTFGLANPVCKRLKPGEDRGPADRVLNGGPCRWIDGHSKRAMELLGESNAQESLTELVELLDVMDEYILSVAWSDQEAARIERIYSGFQVFRDAAESQDVDRCVQVGKQMRADIDFLCAGH